MHVQLFLGGVKLVSGTSHWMEKVLNDGLSVAAD
jgi:hypothetical protein